MKKFIVVALVLLGAMLLIALVEQGKPAPVVPHVEVALSTPQPVVVVTPECVAFNRVVRGDPFEDPTTFWPEACSFADFVREQLAGSASPDYEAWSAQLQTLMSHPLNYIWEREEGVVSTPAEIKEFADLLRALKEQKPVFTNRVYVQEVDVDLSISVMKDGVFTPITSERTLADEYSAPGWVFKIDYTTGVVQVTHEKTEVNFLCFDAERAAPDLDYLVGVCWVTSVSVDKTPEGRAGGVADFYWFAGEKIPMLASF